LNWGSGSNSGQLSFAGGSFNLLSTGNYTQRCGPSLGMTIADTQSNGDVKQLLKELIFNRRHLRCTVIFLVQTWYSIEKDIRKLFSNIFCFRVSKQELSTIMDEVVESKAKYMNDIAKLVFDEAYKYLFINVNTQMLFDGFDELIFDEE